MDGSWAEAEPVIGTAYKRKANEEKNNYQVFHLTGFLN